MVNSYREEGSHADDMSDSASETDDKNNGSSGRGEQCTNPHDGRLLLQQEFALSIDELFTMLFTNCKFHVELREVRNVTDYVELCQWQKQEDGAKCRKLKFTQGLTGMPLGPKESYVTETQTMNACSKPGVLYSIDSTNDNANVPYADYFSVCVHFCLQRVSRSSTMLSLYAHIKYKKSTVFKGFIEKNSMVGLSDYCQVLESKLNAEIASRTAIPVGNRRRGRRRVPASSPQEPVSRPKPQHAPGSNPAPPLWLLTIVLVLFAANAVLFYKLHYEQRTAGSRIYDLQHRLTSIQSTETTEWLRLLERHATQHRDQLVLWREAVQTTVTRLAQAEQDLKKLLDAIKPSLESAQREAKAHIHI